MNNTHPTHDQQSATPALELFLGPMRGNKTGLLIHRILMLREHGKKNVVVFKPTTDTKSAKGAIETRDAERQRIEAHEVPPDNPQAIFDQLRAEEQQLGQRVHWVAIDEGQFFPELFRTVDQLLRQGYNVLVAGLDLNFRGEPFGEMSALTSLAASSNGKMTWCFPHCTVCGEQAIYSQRLIDGKPSPYDSPLFAAGDSYEPRCRAHFELPGRPSN
jgi:thymidine kinase